MADKYEKLIHDLKLCSGANHFLVGGERYKGQALGGLFREALDLINRQKAEIERLQKQLDDKCDRCIAKDRAEAITEFAERLCEDRVSNDPVVIAVKTELKMMKEGVNNA